jgi:hypothetical protein
MRELSHPNKCNNVHLEAAYPTLSTTRNASDHTGLSPLRKASL